MLTYVQICNLMISPKKSYNYNFYLSELLLKNAYRNKLRTLRDQVLSYDEDEISSSDGYFDDFSSEFNDSLF